MAALRRAIWPDIRGHWVPVLALSVLLALVGGSAIGALVGARRTDTVVDRVLTSMRSGDADVDVSPESGIDAASVRRLPLVTQSALGAYVLGLEVKPDGSYGDFDLVAIAAGDDDYGRVLNRTLLVGGRRADPRNEAEVTINEGMARTKRLGLGDSFTHATWNLDQMEALNSGGLVEPAGTRTRFRVTGIVRDAPDILERRGERRFYPTLAWWRAHGETSVHYGPNLIVSLRRGADDLPALRRALSQLGGSPDGVGEPSEQSDIAQKAVRVQAIALYLFAALAAAVGVTIVAQAVARQDTGSAVRLGQLRALGMTRRQLLAVATGRPATVAVLGTALAVAVAVGTSGLLPFGLAGSMEPAPGVVVRPGLLAVGAAVVLTLVLLASLPAGLRSVWRAARPRADERDRPARTPNAASALGPAAGAGVAMALDPGQGRAAIPVRTTVFGIVLGVTAVVASATFVSSLDRLITTPARYGFPFDAVLGTSDSDDVSEVVPDLDETGALSDLTQIATTRLLVNDTDTPAFGIDSVRGAALPTVLRGRLPAAANEMALGEQNLGEVGTRLGATVTAQNQDDGPRGRLRVVGTVRLPPDINAPGSGAVLTLQGLRRLEPEAPINLFYITLGPGKTLRDLGEFGDPGNVSLPKGSADLANIARVRGLPTVLAGLLAGIAFASLVHALTAGVRRRRHDLAVLRVLGFTGRQLSGILAAQATTFAVIALALGVPAGVAVGRWGWTIVARDQGVATDPAVPLLGLVVASTVLVAAANLVAAAPAWAARRVRPATVLRAE